MIDSTASADTYFGYFSDAGQEHPAYDPGPDAPCPYCGIVLASQDVRTISLMYVDQRGRDRSYFYRVHRLCADRRSQEEQDALEHRLMGLLA